jgi:two-component system CheB/CheR fusion protein
MEQRGLEFVVEIEGNPIYVDGDPARLQQVQVNMLTNAAKYTPRGGHVVLEARREADEAVIVVRDDGAGIPSAMLDRVFDLFVQSDRTLDRADGGLGLGLTLVRSLVVMHGGTVHAVSEGEGKGCEFVVRLPVSSSRAVAARESQNAPVLPRGSKIVVIEDNEDSRELLCQLLVLSGFECRGAEDGLKGLALIDELRPDLAIVDVGLPGIDGFEVARRIRTNPKHAEIRLIALTGYGQRSDQETALAAGFDVHLVKPVQPDRLAMMLMRGNTPTKDGQL